jgi:glycosyltransferase involved in cell wall biosynthesis
MAPKPVRSGAERVSSSKLKAVLRSMIENGDQLIHDNGAWLISNHAAAVVAQEKSLPRLVSPRGMLSSSSLSQKKWKKMLAWQLYQGRDLASATAFHVTSELEAEGVRPLGFRGPIAIVPNGITLPPGLRFRGRREEIKTALFLGRLHPQKGVLDLVIAWSRVQPMGWRLQIAGPDDVGHRREVEMHIARCGLTDVVSFSGDVADGEKWDVYRRADLFVLPTRGENFGMAIAEALASGTPVITTKRAPWPTLIDHRCGWWIDPSIDDLVAALHSATKLPRSALEEMGDRGRQYVQNELSWDRVASKMLQLYQWLAGDAGKPDFLYT